jgi:hypothetical protein
VARIGKHGWKDAFLAKNRLSPEKEILAISAHTLVFHKNRVFAISCDIRTELSKENEKFVTTSV